MQYKQRRKSYSQNCIYDQKLIHDLVSKSSINADDTVLEIGPGKGFITAEILKAAKRVITVEVDEKLVLHLKARFGISEKLTVRHGDIFDFNLPKADYKVFANIPFATEGQIVRKLIDDFTPPKDSYLVIDKRLAERLSGLPRDNLFSISHKPFFDFTAYYRFKPTDFIPVPKVEAIMWRIHKKEVPLVPFKERMRFMEFVTNGFGQGEGVSKNIISWVGKDKFEAIQRKLSFTLKVKPGCLDLGKWIRIYEVYTKSHESFKVSP